MRRQPDDHNFGSLLMLAVTAGAFLLVIWVATKALFFFLHESSIPLNASSQSASFLPGIHLPSRANNRQAAATPHPANRLSPTRVYPPCRTGSVPPGIHPLLP